MQTAVTAVQKLINDNNLPIAVHAVLLETDKKKIIRWLPPFYSDVHRVHQLLRFGLADQLDNAATYAGSFVQQIGDAISNGGVQADVAQAGTYRTQVKAFAAQGASKLRGTYDALQADPSWRSDVQSTQQNAGQLKQGVSSVAKTDFTTPFDAVIGSPHLELIGPLETIIQTKPVLRLPVQQVSDPYLNLLLVGMQTGSDKVDLLRTRLLDPGNTAAQKAVIQGQLNAAEAELSASVTSAATQVQSSKIDGKQGTDGLTVMQAVAANASKLSNQVAVASLREGLASVEKGATSVELKGILSTILTPS